MPSKTAVITPWRPDDNKSPPEKFRRMVTPTSLANYVCKWPRTERGLALIEGLSFRMGLKKHSSIRFRIRVIVPNAADFRLGQHAGLVFFL